MSETSSTRNKKKKKKKIKSILTRPRKKAYHTEIFMLEGENYYQKR